MALLLLLLPSLVALLLALRQVVHSNQLGGNFAVHTLQVSAL
jgi:hypothetical protein